MHLARNCAFVSRQVHTAWALALVMTKLCTQGACHRLAPLVLAVVLCMAPLATAKACRAKFFCVEVKVPAHILRTFQQKSLCAIRTCDAAAESGTSVFMHFCASGAVGHSSNSACELQGCFRQV